MLSLTHAAIGGIAGEYISSPPLAFIAGILLHFVADKIPHFWPKEDSKKGIVIIVDTSLSLLFILILFLFLHSSKSASVIAGAIGGVSVDFYFVLLMRSKGKLAQWHTNRQPHRSDIIWILTDLIIFSLAILSLWSFK